MTPRYLIDGQFVTVYLEGAEPVLTITLPRAAVLQDQQGAYRLRGRRGEQGGAAQHHASAARPGEVAVIETGLQGGETVIVEGVAARPPRPAGEPRARPRRRRHGARQRPARG